MFEKASAKHVVVIGDAPGKITAESKTIVKKANYAIVLCRADCKNEIKIDLSGAICCTTTFNLNRLIFCFTLSVDLPKNSAIATKDFWACTISRSCFSSSTVQGLTLHECFSLRRCNGKSQITVIKSNSWKLSGQL